MLDLNATLAERGARYGKFTDHARITLDIKRVIHSHTPRELDDDMLEALDMIAHKIGRILAGDPHYVDSWVDIAGYAQLVANRLSGEGVQ